MSTIRQHPNSTRRSAHRPAEPTTGHRNLNHSPPKHILNPIPENAPSSTFQAPPPKLLTQEPITISRFFITLIVQSCKSYLFFVPRIKALIYLIIVFFGSLIRDLVLSRTKRLHTYLAKPDNFVMEYLVEYDHIWTLIVLSAFVAWTSYVYSGGKPREVFRNVFRVNVPGALYYVALVVFGAVGRLTGFCSNEEIRDREFCLQEGYRWMNLEISREAFSLILFALVIMEEADVFRTWETLGTKLRVDAHQTLTAPQQTSRNVTFVKTAHKKYQSAVQVSFVWLAFLCMLWDAMLVATCIFMQSLPEKIFGAVIAVVLWALLYRVWFPRLWPHLPGKGIVRTVLRKNTKK